MSKHINTKLDSVFFEKYKDSWVITSQSVVEGGAPYISSPPVRVISLNDKTRFKKVLLEVLNEVVSIISGKTFDALDFEIDESYKLEALGLKSMRKFYKDSRGFWLKTGNSGLHVEEWKKYKGGGYTGKLWEKDFTSEDYEGLIEYLIQKVKISTNEMDM